MSFKKGSSQVKRPVYHFMISFADQSMTFLAFIMHPYETDYITIKIEIERLPFDQSVNLPRRAPDWLTIKKIYSIMEKPDPDPISTEYAGRKIWLVKVSTIITCLRHFKKFLILQLDISSLFRFAFNFSPLYISKTGTAIRSQGMACSM